MLKNLSFVGDDTALQERITRLVALPPNEEEIVKALGAVGEILINDCRFQFKDGSEFIPLWVEIYYCNKAQGYLDATMDATKAYQKGMIEHDQINHFGRLYFAGKWWSRRVDLVLSDSRDYGLSVLIKAGKLKHQEEEKYLGQVSLRDVFFEKQAPIVWKMENDINVDEAGVFGSSRRVFNNINKATGEKEHYMKLGGLAVHRYPFVCRSGCTPETRYNKFLS